MEYKSDDSSVAASGLLALNKLSYQFQRDLSVSVARNLQTQHFSQNVYVGGDTGVAIWNTGSSYVNPRTCYLELDVTNQTTSAADPANRTKAHFGLLGAGAINLINRITIFSRSGSIIERIDRAAVLAAIRLQYEHDESYLKSNGTLMGLETIADLNWVGSLGPGLSGQTNRFILPLHLISPFFGSVDTLLPAALCSGLRFEIVWEAAENAMVCLPPVVPGVPDVIPSYIITRCQFQADCFLLSDIALRTLNQSAASNSLEVSAVTYHNTISSRTSGQLNLDVGKAVSRALGCVFKERKTSGFIQSSERFASVPLDATSYVSEFQLRLGSLYFPNSAITGTSSRITSPTLMANSLQAFSKFYQDSNTSCSVSEKEFRESKSVFAQTLERSDVMDLSGQPTSNSRILSLNASWNAAPVNGSAIDMYLKYVTLIRVYLSNVIVEV